jgi:hypothetical protein
MRILHRLGLDRAEAAETQAGIAAGWMRRQSCQGQEPEELQQRRAEGVVAQPFKITRLTKLLGGACLVLAALGTPVHVLSAIVPPGQSVTLAWDPCLDTNVVGFNVHYGAASRSYTNTVDAGNATNATISGLVAGTTHFFAVTAYDRQGIESDPSNEVSYTVPTTLPAVQIRAAAARQVVLTVTGQTNHTYEVLATQTFTNWAVIGTVKLGASGSFEFTDPNAASYPARYYRTREKP